MSKMMLEEQQSIQISKEKLKEIEDTFRNQVVYSTIDFVDADFKTIIKAGSYIHVTHIECEKIREGDRNQMPCYLTVFRFKGFYNEGEVKHYSFSFDGALLIYTYLKISQIP